MGVAGAHRREARAARHEPRARAVSRGPVAELAVEVIAPAIGGARGRDPAGVGSTGAQGRDAHAARHKPGAHSQSHGPVAELAVTVVAPAIDGARSRDPAGVAPAGAHRGEGQCDGKQGACRPGEPRRARRERVAASRPVDPQVTERRDPLGRRDGERAREGSRAGVRADRYRHRVRGRRHRVPEGVLHGDLDRRGDRLRGLRRARLHYKGELRRGRRLGQTLLAATADDADS